MAPDPPPAGPATDRPATDPADAAAAGAGARAGADGRSPGRRPHLGSLEEGTLRAAGISEREYRVVNDFLEVMRAMAFRLEETAEAFDLNGPTLLALRQLDVPMSQKEIAASLGCDPSYVTAVVDRLEGMGAVERRTDPDDRRVKRVTLTPDGRRLRGEAGVHLLSEVPAVLGLDDDEVDQLAALLARVVAANADVLAQDWGT